VTFDTNTLILDMRQQKLQEDGCPAEKIHVHEKNPD
jgi:hypothetical protein